MKQKYAIPPEMVNEAQIIVGLIRDVVQSQGFDDHISFSRATKFSYNANGSNEAEDAFLIIDQKSSSWLSRDWLDNYFWPFLLQYKAFTPSRYFLDWLNSKLNVESSNIVYLHSY